MSTQGLPATWLKLPQAVRDAVLSDLQEQRRAEGALHAAINPLRSETPTGLMPASLEQQYLWRRQQAHHYTLAWTMGVTPMPLENVDVPALQKALEALQAHHQSMRTYFVEKNQQLYQCLDSQQKLPLRRAKLPYWRTRAGMESWVIKRQQELVAEPFDIHKGPLWRALLLHRGKNAVLLLSFCSMIFDGGSLGLIQQQLHALYTAFKAGHKPDPTLLSSPYQYTDYAAWQQRESEGEKWQQSVQWWREKLAGQVPAVGRADKPPKAELGTLMFRQTIGSKTTQAINAYAADHNTTPFVVMLTEFMATLVELDGHSDIWVTAPSATRPVKGTESMIGNFMRQVLLRQQWPEQGDALSAVHATVTDALGYGEIPHQLIAEQLNSHAEGSENPWRYFFNYRNSDTATATGSDALVEDMEYFHDKAQRVMSREEHILLLVQERGNARELNWFMRLDRFSEQQTEDLLRGYMRRLRVRLAE